MRIPSIFASVLLLPAMLMTGCRPDKVNDLGEPPTASFTMTPVAGKTNTYALSATAPGAWAIAWDKGTGTFTRGQAADTVYFPTKGSKTVRLRAFGTGGSSQTEESVEVLVDDLMNIPTFALLVAHPWKLDPAAGANAVIVGTEANPSQYFGGGGLADCQLDDRYTFSFGTAASLDYNAAGATFNAGNISPNYVCGSDRSYTGQAISYSPTVPAGSAGIGMFTINATVPTRFVGVTDISSNSYRIISISETSLVLRSGTASETVHQFKFVAP
ncbi:MAG: hypothetical protein EOO09_19190 [Chitinophagaceae bacterium]|nr:MAG: hypothetical protein EOO09_19190 [Chitinophagaceae bacterium]